MYWETENRCDREQSIHSPPGPRPAVTVLIVRSKGPTLIFPCSLAVHLCRSRETIKSIFVRSWGYGPPQATRLKTSSKRWFCLFLFVYHIHQALRSPPEVPCRSKPGKCYIRGHPGGGDGKQQRYLSPSRSCLLALGPLWNLHAQGGHHFHCLVFDGLCLGDGVGHVTTGEGLLSVIPHLGDFGETCLDSVKLRLV